MTTIKYYDTGEEYEPIEIKWDTGFMIIAPPGIWDDPGYRSKFRKLIKLSINSDRTMGTNTISMWRRAFVRALEHVTYFKRPKIEARLRASQESIEREWDRFDDKQKAKRPNFKDRKFKEAERYYKADFKRVEAHQARIEKCKTIFDELIKKYRIEEA
jgi:hypothetical protein